MTTCIAACVGLLPATVSTAIGAQVQRPLAFVVVGGISLAPPVILILFPVLIEMLSGWMRPMTSVDGALEPPNDLLRAVAWG